MKKTWPLVTTAAFAAMMLAGCSAGDPKPESDGDSSSVATEGTGSSAPSTASSSGDDGQDVAKDSGVGIATMDTTKVLAEQEYQLPGTKDKTTFGIQSLVVEGDTMKLTMVMTPDFSSVSDSKTISLFDMAGEGGNPLLIDRENLKEYSVIRQSHRKWTAERVYTRTVNGEPALWWGKYAAPEDDIDAVDIRVLDGMPEFTNVPIER